MCTTECHILKYLNEKLKVIYYIDPMREAGYNNNVIAIAIHDDKLQQIWFRLNHGINIINDDIKIIWESGFIIEYKGKILHDIYYDRNTLACDNLIKIPPNYGYFLPEDISLQFMKFIGTNETVSNKMEMTYYAQWIFWTIILIVAILLLWFMLNNNRV